MPPGSSRKRKAPCDSESDRSLVDDGHSPPATNSVQQGLISTGAGQVKPTITYHNITHSEKYLSYWAQAYTNAFKIMPALHLGNAHS